MCEMGRHANAWVEVEQISSSSWPHLKNRYFCRGLARSQNTTLTAWLLQKGMKSVPLKPVLVMLELGLRNWEIPRFLTGSERDSMGICGLNTGERHEMDREETTSRPLPRVSFFPVTSQESTTFLPGGAYQSGQSSAWILEKPTPPILIARIQ